MLPLLGLLNLECPVATIEKSSTLQNAFSTCGRGQHTCGMATLVRGARTRHQVLLREACGHNVCCRQSRLLVTTPGAAALIYVEQMHRLLTAARQKTASMTPSNGP